MSEDNRNRIPIIILSAGGAILAFFGVFWIIRRIQRQAHDEQYQQRARQRLQRGTRQFAGNQEQPRYQPVDQPDREPIPATGADVDQTIDADLVIEEVEDQGAPDLGQQVGPLVQYLLTFQDFITVLRERQRGGSAGGSLTPGDRGYFQEALDRLAPSLENYGEGNVEDDTLQERIYRLTVKVRDALQNLDYTADDLFRINGEVRSEACRLLREIEGTRANITEDFDRVLEGFEC